MNRSTKKAQHLTGKRREHLTHLIIDGYGSKEKLQDMTLIYDLLDNFPAQIGMSKLMPPFVFVHEPPKIEDSGISGFVIIAESHISIHTFPYKNLVNIDIFSCRTFDSKHAIEFFKEKLDLSDTRVKTVERG